MAKEMRDFRLNRIRKIVQIALWITLIISNVLIIAKAEDLPGIEGGVIEYIEVDSTKETATPEDVENNDEYTEPTRSSYTGYDGSISSTYAEYFKGILYKEQPKHYVIARTSQYQYLLAYGDNLSYSSGVFTGSVRTVIIDINNGYNSYFNITYGTDNSFQLTPNNNMIYSDLGRFPIINYQTDGTIVKGGIFFVTATVLAVFMYWIIRSAFSRTIRFY